MRRRYKQLTHKISPIISTVPSIAISMAAVDALWQLSTLLTLPLIASLALPIVLIPLLVIGMETITREVCGLKQTKWQEKAYLYAQIFFGMLGFTLFSLIPVPGIIAAIMLTGLGAGLFALIPVILWEYKHPQKEKTKLWFLWLCCSLAGSLWTLHTSATVTALGLSGLTATLLPALCIFLTSALIFTIYTKLNQYWDQNSNQFSTPESLLLISANSSILLMLVLPVTTPIMVTVISLATITMVTTLIGNYRAATEKSALPLELSHEKPTRTPPLTPPQHDSSPAPENSPSPKPPSNSPPTPQKKSSSKN
jgi:hypothetical protein